VNTLPRRLIPYIPVCTVCTCLFVFALILSPLQNPTSLGDGIRHLALAQILHQGKQFGGWGDFVTSGYFSLHSSDPWYLTHLLITPLGALDTVLAQKIFILILGFAVGASFLLILSSLKIPSRMQSVCVLVLFLGNVQWMLRLLLGRPVFMMVSLLLLLLLSFLQRKTWPLLPLMTIATLLSHLFVFPLFLCLLGSLWFVLQREYRKASCSMVYAALGVSVAFLLIPQNLNYVHYIAEVFLKVPFNVQLFTGTEMQSGIHRMAPIVVLLGACTLFLRILRMQGRTTKEEMMARGIVLTGTLVGFMTVGMLVWVRMLDFLWPLLLVLLAQILSLCPSLPTELARYLLPKRVLKKRLAWAVLLLIIFVNIAKTEFTFLSTDADRNLGQFADAFKEVPPQSRVLNLDWDLFPALFTVRPDLLYTRGMDPSYDYLVSPHSIDLYSVIRTQTPDAVDWDNWLRELTQYVPSDVLVLWSANRSAVLNHLRTIPNLTLLRRNERIAVFKIATSLTHEKE